MMTIGMKRMKPTQLVHHLALGLCSVPANQTVQIVERSTFNDELYLSLLVPSLQTESVDVRLWWCLTTGGSNYCIVARTIDFDEDQPTTALMVVRVIDQNTLYTISPDEFENIAADCQRVVYSLAHAQEDDVRQMLGAFPLFEF
jgi:hypothetical protein